METGQSKAVIILSPGNCLGKMPAIRLQFLSSKILNHYTFG